MSQITFMTLDWNKEAASSRVQQVLRCVALELINHPPGSKVFFEHILACGTVKKGTVGTIGAFAGPTFLATYGVPDSQLEMEINFLVPSSSFNINPMTDEGLIRVLHTTHKGTELVDEYHSSEVRAPEIHRMNS